jgi:hypothetical protein
MAFPRSIAGGQALALPAALNMTRRSRPQSRGRLTAGGRGALAPQIARTFYRRGKGPRFRRSELAGPGERSAGVCLLLCILATSAIAGSAIPASDHAQGAFSGRQDTRSASVSDRGGDAARELVVGSTPRSGSSEGLAFDAHRAAWAAGGALIGFGATRGAQQHDSLWVMRADGTRKRKLAGWDLYSSLAPSGRLFAEVGHDLVVRTLAGKRVRAFSIRRHSADIDYVEFTWSRDERSLAFEVDREDDRGDWTLIFATASGRGTRSISRVRRPHDSTPRWSPDGRRIAFVSCPGDSIEPGGCNLMLMRPDGTQRTIVRRHAGNFLLQPVWSPDSRWLAFAAKFGPELPDPSGESRQRIGIYIVRIDGSRFRRVAATRPTTDAYSYVAWSPNGRQLAYSSPGGVLVTTPGHAGATRVARKGRQSPVSWAPAKRMLFADGAVLVIVPGRGPVALTG